MSAVTNELAMGAAAVLAAAGFLLAAGCIFGMLLLMVIFWPVRRPEPLTLRRWPSKPFNRRLDHRTTATIETLCDSPRVALARGVLSDAECGALIDLAEPLITRGLYSSGEVTARPSLLPQPRMGRQVPGRTSKHTTLLAGEHAQHPTVQLLAARTATLLDRPVSHIEALQLVRYHEGQEFPVHHDTLEPVMLASEHHQRLVTAFVYLNTLKPKQGGNTLFPLLGIQVRPEAGCVLLWPNTNTKGKLDPLTIHAAEPPLQGATKYGVNVWFRGCVQNWRADLIVGVKQLVPVNWRTVWPSGLASSFCMYCGSPLANEVSRWHSDNHGKNCLFRDELAKLDWARVKHGESMVLKAKQTYGTLTRNITYNPCHLREIVDTFK